MNYPVWDVAFGAGLLMAVVSILHVFVSHFAVGGGLFLVLTERRARKRGDTAMLGWLKSHTRFFVLLTVVFGAVSGVGIWFTIGLINPTATSNLIHAYVWGWAIEWVFFFLEITAALLYLYGWDKLPPRLHMWYGWVYFIAAFASMVIINGIVTFMLTPGGWIQNHEFWTGFFNPTYFPSLAARFAIALALAGIYALVTASAQRDEWLKAKIVTWSALWILPAFVVLPGFIWWYARSIPIEFWSSTQGAMPTATRFAQLAAIFSTATFVAAILALLSRNRLRLWISMAVLLLALGTMGSLEFVREAVRKPYAIANYLYGNSLYSAPTAGDAGFTVEQIDRAGVLKTAKWVDVVAGDPDAVAGRQIFRVECESCHTANAYRGVKQYLALRNWDRDAIEAMLASLDMMHGGVMPPFAGTDTERRDLAAYLATIYRAEPPPGAQTGEQIFMRNCAPCHQHRAADSLFTLLPAMDHLAAADALKDLPGMFVRMPPLKLGDQDRAALVQWIDLQFPAKAGTGAR
jgi:mono/diheme cytochrome c family protein